MRRTARRVFSCSKLVFPFSKDGENCELTTGISIKCQARTGLGGSHHLRHITTQKRVDLGFDFDGAWQSRLPSVTLKLAPRPVLGCLRIAWLHRRCKFQVCQRVLVGTAYPGIGWQTSQPMLGSKHLLGRTFKKAAAASRKKRVAAKQDRGLLRARQDIGHMAGCVARNVHDLELPWAHLDGLAI